MYSLRVLSRRGDDQVTWTDEDVATQSDRFQEARRFYNELFSRGYAAFAVDPVTKEARPVRAFEAQPEEKQITFIPALQGG